MRDLLSLVSLTALAACIGLAAGEPPARPAWAAAAGQDAAGAWCEVAAGHVPIRLRWIPPGSFAMGSPEMEEDREADETQHVVALTRGFWLADREVTQALWQAVMRDVPAQPVADPQLPVVLVSWDDAQAFLGRLSAMVVGLRAGLPTEAQWEYACRAGTTSPWALPVERISPDPNAHGPRPVASGGANAWGLYDMHGNVAEWCQDWYGAYAIPAPADPRGPDTGTERVIRGGSWLGVPSLSRSATRERAETTFRWHQTGLRICIAEP
jgi:sulfatase modifying factor 1